MSTCQHPTINTTAGRIGRNPGKIVHRAHCPACHQVGPRADTEDAAKAALSASATATPTAKTK